MKTERTDYAELRAALSDGSFDFDQRAYMNDVRALLTERDALRLALEDELNWHEAQDKVLSKQPDAYIGHNWGRWIQHQEHAAVIRAALGQEQGD